MYTIVGLGNPGKKYEHTRHNVGRLVLNAFLERYHFPDMASSGMTGDTISTRAVNTESVQVLFPGTYMNESGPAVKRALSMGGDAAHLIVVHDDLDLPRGSFKVSWGSGSGGHNGVESIIDALDTKLFTRVRIGISPVSLFGHIKKPHGDTRVTRFVLHELPAREAAILDELAPKVVDAITSVITEGVERAMNRYN